jgi:general secretion pathway protein K
MTNRLMSKLRGNEGIALITTLMVIALLMAVVVEFNRIAIADIDISRNFGNEKKILFVTISGVNAIRELLRLDGLYTKSDTLQEGWAKSRSYFGSASAILDEGKVEGEIVDENGKIYVNGLINDKGEFDEIQKGIWERLLSQPKFGLAEEEVKTIIYGVKDWIDKDDEMAEIYGAEDSFYLSKGYHCKNGALDTLEEMLLIKGVTEEIFYGSQEKIGIRPYFTVFGDRAININTAPVPVLMALSDDMTEEIAIGMDEFRRDKANQILLNAKSWYKKIWPFEKPLPEKVMTISSDFFTVHIRGTLRESVKEIKTVIFRSKGTTNVVYWQEM